MRSPEQSSGCPKITLKRALWGTTAGIALFGAGAVALHEAAEEPNEWEQPVAKTIEAARQDASRQFLLTLNDTDANGSVTYHLTKEKGDIRFEVARGKDLRRFRLEKVHDLPKDAEGKVCAEKKPSEYSEQTVIGSLQGSKEMDRHIRLYGDHGMITVAREEVERLFRGLRDSGKDADPLVIGHVPCRVEGERFYISYRNDHVGNLYFKEEKVEGSPDAEAIALVLKPE